MPMRFRRCAGYLKKAKMQGYRRFNIISYIFVACKILKYDEIESNIDCMVCNRLVCWMQ